MRINGQKDAIAGVLFIILGAVLFFAARRYEVGTAVSMGPGYFPALCGVVLMLLGAGSVIVGLRAKVLDAVSMEGVVALFFILLSIASFALLIERAGLVVASFVCLFFACFKRVLTHPLEVLLIFLALTAFNLVVFVYVFEMPVQVFWWR